MTHRGWVGSNPTAIETLDEKILTLAKTDEIYPRVKKWIEDPDGKPTKTINLVEFSGEKLGELEEKINPICEEILKKRDLPGEALGYFITGKAREISELWNLRKKKGWAFLATCLVNENLLPLSKIPQFHQNILPIISLNSAPFWIGMELNTACTVMLMSAVFMFVRH